MGDSVTQQMWTSLTCGLMQSAEARVVMRWAATRVDYCREYLRETGEHCHSECGDVLVSLNCSVHYRAMSKQGAERQFMNALGELRMGQGDIVIANVGVHFNDPNSYRRQLQEFVKIFANTTAYPTSMYFIESTPQHAPGFPNGYYHKDVFHNVSDPNFKVSERGCTPLHLSEKKEDELLTDDKAATPWRNDVWHQVRDWRNDVLHEVLNGTRWKIVTVAKELQSQFDAHLGYANGWNAHHVMAGIHEVKLDCLHWSMDSGVFRYILTKIYNKLLQHESPVLDPRAYLLLRNIPDKTPVVEATRYGRETFVYLGGTKHRMKDGIATFNRLGLSFDRTVHLTPLEFDLIPWGLDLD